MKKYLLITSSIILLLFGCTKKENNKLLYGKWQIRGYIFNDFSFDLDSADKSLTSLLEQRLRYNNEPLTANDTIAMRETMDEMAKTLDNSFIIFKDDNTIKTIGKFDSLELTQDSFPLVWAGNKKLLMSEDKSDTATILELTDNTLILGNNTGGADAPKAIILHRHRKP